MDFNQLESRLQTLAPEYTGLRRQAAQAQNAVLAAEIRAQQAWAEYDRYANVNASGLDEEHQQKLERIQTELRYRAEQAQSQVSAAEGQLRAIQGRLSRAASELRGLVGGYEQLKVELAEELRKIEDAAAQVSLLDPNRYAGGLAEVKGQIAAARGKKQQTYQNCNTRIRQILAALNEDEGKDPPVKVKTR